MRVAKPVEVVIEDLRAVDRPAVREVYEQALPLATRTFETAAPEWDAWDEAHLRGPRLVARTGAAGGRLDDPDRHLP